MRIVMTPQLVLKSNLLFLDVSGNGGVVRFFLPVNFNPQSLSGQTLSAVNELFTHSSARRQGLFDSRYDGGEFAVVEKVRALLQRSVSFSVEELMAHLRSACLDVLKIARYLDNDNVDQQLPQPSWAREWLMAAQVPTGWTTLPRGLFFGCQHLSTVSLPAGLTSIASSAIAFCFNLEALHIPDSVTFFAKDAFLGCPRLTIFCSEAVYQRMSAMKEPLVFAQGTRLCVRGEDGRRRLMLNAQGQADDGLPPQLRALIRVTSNDQLVLLIVAWMRRNFAGLTPGQCMERVLIEYPDVTLENIRVVFGEAVASPARHAVLSKADLSFLSPSSLDDLLPGLFQFLSFSDFRSFALALLAATPRGEAGSKRKLEMLPEPRLGPLLGILFRTPDDEKQGEEPSAAAGQAPRAPQMAIEAAKPPSP